MLIDQLNNYIDHHKNKRAVALMIKAVNELGRLYKENVELITINHDLSDKMHKLQKQIEDLQKENTHIAYRQQKETNILGNNITRMTLNPKVERDNEYNLTYFMFICIVVLVVLIIIQGVSC